MDINKVIDMEEKKIIGVAQVLEHLKNGMTRKDIATHYSITMSECKILFQHPDLKGRRTIKKPSFVIVPDEETANEAKGKDLLDAFAPEEEQEMEEEILEGNPEKEEVVEKTMEAEEEKTNPLTWQD